MALADRRYTNSVILVKTVLGLIYIFFFPISFLMRCVMKPKRDVKKGSASGKVFLYLVLWSSCSRTEFQSKVFTFLFHFAFHLWG